MFVLLTLPFVVLYLLYLALWHAGSMLLKAGSRSLEERAVAIRGTVHVNGSAAGSSKV